MWTKSAPRTRAKKNVKDEEGEGAAKHAADAAEDDGKDAAEDQDKEEDNVEGAVEDDAAESTEDDEEESSSDDSNTESSQESKASGSEGVGADASKVGNSKAPATPKQPAKAKGLKRSYGHGNLQNVLDGVKTAAKSKTKPKPKARGKGQDAETTPPAKRQLKEEPGATPATGPRPRRRAGRQP